MSVTESYSHTYSLNTVVSDLMALTNLITEVGNLHKVESKGEKSHMIRNQEELLLQRSATLALVQMMAPITPAFAEECWSRLHLPPSSSPGSWLAKTLLQTNHSNIVSDSNRIIEIG